MKIKSKTQQTNYKKNTFFAMWNLKSETSQRGFTLIELLVVIAIIGILTTVLMVNFIGVRQRARDAQRKSHVKQVQSAFELYRSDHTQYPCFGAGCASNNANIIDGMSVTLGSYLSDEVKDPLPNSSCSNYFISSSGSTYTVFTILENANDIDATTDKPAPKADAGNSHTCNGSQSANGKCTSYTVVGNCNATFNYWVNNP